MTDQAEIQITAAPKLRFTKTNVEYHNGTEWKVSIEGTVNRKPITVDGIAKLGSEGSFESFDPQDISGYVPRSINLQAIHDAAVGFVKGQTIKGKIKMSKTASRMAAPNNTSGMNPNVPIRLYDTHPNERYRVGEYVVKTDPAEPQVKGKVLARVTEDRLLVEWPTEITQEDCDEVMPIREHFLSSRAADSSSYVSDSDPEMHDRTMTASIKLPGKRSAGNREALFGQWSQVPGQILPKFHGFGEQGRNEKQISQAQQKFDMDPNHVVLRDSSVQQYLQQAGLAPNMIQQLARLEETIRNRNAMEWLAKAKGTKAKDREYPEWGYGYDPLNGKKLNVRPRTSPSTTSVNPRKPAPGTAAPGTAAPGTLTTHPGWAKLSDPRYQPPHRWTASVDAAMEIRQASKLFEGLKQPELANLLRDTGTSILAARMTQDPKDLPVVKSKLREAYHVLSQAEKQPRLAPLAAKAIKVLAATLAS